MEAVIILTNNYYTVTLSLSVTYINSFLNPYITTT